MARTPFRELPKITRPILGGTLPRKRLFRLLDRARKKPIVWISGPAGCGKTTLVSSYFSARGCSCLWYQVDEGDHDIASFFHYMGLAARKAAPGKSKPLPPFAPEYLPGLSGFTRRYFESLFGRLPAGSSVVFDDFQKVEAGPGFQDVIRDGVGRIPEGISVVVISRADPSPLFARERAQQRMETIGWKELRLTPEETKGIARLRGRKRLGPEEVRSLQGRSDGWAAGLVLLLENSPKADGQPQRISGRAPGEIFDYFAGEVFAGLDDDAKSFLLKSAFLPRMTASMAERITGRRHAGITLSRLNRHNFFTELHRYAEPVYEYHPLFRDFLLSRAGDIFSQKFLDRLRSLAGTILEESGHDEDAFGLFRESGNGEGMTRVILRQASQLVRQGRSGTLAEWIDSVPKDQVEGNPWLLYWRGTCRLGSRPEDGRRDFEKAFQGFRLGRNPEGIFLAWSGVVDAIVYGPGNLESLEPWFSILTDLVKDLQTFPSAEIEARVTCTSVKALALRRPSLPGREKWADRATELARSIQDPPLKFSLLLNVAFYRFHGGDLHAVALLLESLRGMVRKPEISPLSRLTLSWLEAACANMSGMHDRCMKAVTEGLEFADAVGIRLMDMLLMGHGALCSLHSGDPAAARSFLRRMATALPAARPWEASFYHYLAAWEALERGDGTRALLHSDHCLTACREVGNPWTEAQAGLQRAFIFHRGGETEKASGHLALARRVGEENGLKFIRFACLLAESYFSLGDGNGGDEAAGLDSLREGLRIGRELGYGDTYLWHPGLLERVVALALAKGIETEYARELVRRNGLVPSGALRDIEGWPWPVKIFTLGRFDVLREEEPLPSPRKVQRRPLLMLKALIALGGRNVPEERITDAIWPDADGDLAHQSFSMTLTRLRRLLGSEKTLSLREDRLTLDTRFCWVDAFAFESLLARVDAGIRDGAGVHGSDAVRAADRAVALYRGSFLAEEPPNPWIATSRDRLRSKFLRAVGFLGRCLERDGRWTEAAACYQKGLEVDNLAEEFYRRLMICHRRLGNNAEALGVYDRCRKTLTAVLGIPPSPETEAIAKSFSHS